MIGMPVQRGYRQACGIAHGLDLVGERWALLVVRELLLGPKRFTDLRRALPAASPNALTDRLRELTAAGVARRRRLPPPAASWVYELTDWGRQLEPALIGLGTWALGSDLLDGDAYVSADSVMLAIRSYFKPKPTTATKPSATLEIRLTDEDEEQRFGVWMTNVTAEPRHDLPPHPEAVLTAHTATLLATFNDRHRFDRALDDGTLTVDGDRRVARRLLGNVVIPGPAPLEARS